MASKDDIVRMMGLSAPLTMPEAALDDEGVRGVDVSVEGAGLDLSPGDDLAAGIAAVFDAIRNSDDDADADDTAPEDTGVTFALLTELNRLWERAPM